MIICVSDPTHFFLRVSGDARPLVFLHAVSPEVSQVLRAVPAPEQVHGLCGEQTFKTLLRHLHPALESAAGRQLSYHTLGYCE